MSLFTNKWPRIALPVATLSILVLMLLGGGANSSAAPSQQTPSPQPTPQTTKPVLLTDAVPDPKQEGVLWFASTSHTLRGKFFDYWQSHGGLAQFGYPLTEEFFEEVGADHKQFQVQYFERNRFELHPENAGTQYEVLLGTLGLDFHKADTPVQQQSDAQYFPETGHNLSGKFLQYWQTHGGLAVQGYPITEAQMERSTNGKDYLTQWFERSRLELHLENAGSPYEVLLGVLGRQLSEKKGYPFGWFPRYGRAADFSWVSGNRHPRGGCFNCSCTFDNNRAMPALNLQPAGPVWQSATTSEQVKYFVPIVLFGRLPIPGEPVPQVTCAISAYIVAAIQPNPIALSQPIQSSFYNIP